MKIGEARQLYGAQLRAYQDQKRELAEQKKVLEAKIKATPDGQSVFGEEAAALELSYNAVSEKYDEFRNYMDKLSELHSAYFNAEATKQQGEAMKKYAEDLAKILEVARRIANGDIVPAADEKKLMDYNMELYMSAKNMALINKEKEAEEYDSLWQDEEEKTENPDPFEAADNAEANVGMEAPAIEASANAPAEPA